jgi:transcriptional regulator with XRE-family HTH domain
MRRSLTAHAKCATVVGTARHGPDGDDVVAGIQGEQMGHQEGTFRTGQRGSLSPTRDGLGEYLERYLAANDMSVAHLAAKTGLSPAQMRKLIKGENSPTLRTLMRLAAAIGVDVSELARSYQEGEERRLDSEIQREVKLKASVLIALQGGEVPGFDYHNKKRLLDLLQALPSSADERRRVGGGDAGTG